jgi:hypothetical protein
MAMRRFLGLILVLGLIFGGAAACSSSDSSKTTSSDSGGGGGTTSSKNAKVQEYCKAVDDYVAKVKAAEGDASKVAALTKDSQALAQKAQALATGLSAEDAQAVAACTKKSTDALQP